MSQPSSPRRAAATLPASADPLPHAIWAALTTAHQHLALTQGQARRYPNSVAPFAAVAERTPSAFADLYALLHPGESVYLLGEPPLAIPGLHHDGSLSCFQMVFPEAAPLLPSPPSLEPPLPLTCQHAAEMLALITRAYPGLFRSETCRMGRYWGTRDPGGALLAMGGERLIVTPPGQTSWREVSGLCTDPVHPGMGLGTALLTHILAQHRAEGARSWLHVTTSNVRAIALYQKLGFIAVRQIDLHRVVRLLS